MVRGWINHRPAKTVLEKWTLAASGDIGACESIVAGSKAGPLSLFKQLSRLVEYVLGDTLFVFKNSGNIQQRVALPE